MSLLPQVPQNCCGSGKRAGRGAEVFGVTIRRSDYAGICRLNDVLFWTLGSPVSGFDLVILDLRLPLI